MKIKRFEASNMAEALRMVKKEFGEEAVILSAKTQKKPARLFGGQSGGQVVVTAAIDTASPARDTAVSISPTASAAMQDAAAAGDRIPERKSAYGISRILQHFTPITRTGQKKLQPKLIRLMNEAQNESCCQENLSQDQPVYERLREQGLTGVICDELAEQVSHLMADDDSGEEETLSILSQIIETKGWVAPSAPNSSNAARIVVMVGPHGVGKTTMAARLAAHAVLNAGESVALLSLDDQRIAGASELQRYAGIMGVHFESAGNPDQVKAALQRMNEARLVIVDTPGVGPNDTCGKANLGRLLDLLGDSEIHLLIHAGNQEQVVSSTIQHYKSFKINRLLPTHMDWCRQFGPFINQLRRHRWPISYMGIGPQVPEGLRLLTAKHLAAILLGQAPKSEVEEIPRPVTIVQRSTTSNAERYVANRNSDIFHEMTCKSVARINDDNAIIFRDPADAIGRGFKPCRMCCMAHFAPKPIERRENKYYAGSRN